MDNQTRKLIDGGPQDKKADFAENRMPLGMIRDAMPFLDDSISSVLLLHPHQSIIQALLHYSNIEKMTIISKLPSQINHIRRISRVEGCSDSIEIDVVTSNSVKSAEYDAIICCEMQPGISNVLGQMLTKGG